MKDSEMDFRQHGRRQITKDVFFFGALLAVSCFLFWKCHYGFGSLDESFYLTIPYRLYQGDALFQDEWHVTQMSGSLTLPVVALYVALKGSTDGLILAMRYVCTVIQCLMAVVLYFRTKKINWLGAFVASISFVLYIPFGIMALSYNSIGIMALLGSTVFLLTAERYKSFQYMLAGVLFAIAVLCSPYLMLVYVLYLAAVGIRTIIRWKKKLARDDSILTVKGALLFTSGAAAVAVIFFGSVLSRASLSDVLYAIPQILNDPEHPPVSLFTKTKDYFWNIIHSGYFYPETKYVYGFLVALLTVWCVDRKRNQHKAFFTCILAGCTLVLIYTHFHYNDFINHVMWPVNVLALALVILSENPKIREIFCTIWIPGILYSYCINLSSNTGFYAIASASAVATFGSLLIIAVFLSDLRRDSHGSLFQKAATVAACLVFSCQLLAQGVLRYEAVFDNSFLFCKDEMAAQTMYVEDGLNAGIYVSEERYNEYYYALDMLDAVEQSQCEKVLYLSDNTWYYLQGSKNMATYSAWLSGVNEHTLSRLDAYYEINPDKFPDIVFVDLQYKDIAMEFCSKFNYCMQATDLGFFLTPVV